MAETQSYQRNQFNTTEGGLFFGHVMRNNAKMAVALRAIFPSNFTKGHFIGLQQSGKLRGSIINSAPATYQIFCGEKPVNGKAGVWFAEKYQQRANSWMLMVANIGFVSSTLPVQILLPYIAVSYTHLTLPTKRIG